MPVKVTVYLPKPATEALKDLALKRNTTPTEILRHAISLEKELNDELTQGARVLLEKDGDFRELVV
jgi:predicted transcriptional regulator